MTVQSALFAAAAAIAGALAAAPAAAQQNLVETEVALPANVRVFAVPEGSRPHDVAPAPDGKIWYTGQRRGTHGILDPETGEIREVPLGEGSAPHGVIQGPDGNAWITDGGLNAIVRVDSETDEVTVWPLPGEFPKSNLNTAAFDGDGNVWFTGQTGVYGRLDPDTGEMQVWRDPEGRGPYGIHATPDGQIWYVSLAGSHLARPDLETGELTIVEPTVPDAGTRRVWSDSKGKLWVSEWNGGKLARYDPETGQWQSWPLEGERPRVYAVYVDDRDVVWVSDFGANAVLSFNPATERWARYPGSGPDSNVRQILGRPGEVYLPESGLDRIMVIRTGEESQ